MTRLSRRPTRTQSRRFASTLSLFFLALFALLLVCPAAVKADEDKEKYGPVIGIGACIWSPELLCALLTLSDRFGYHVSPARTVFQPNFTDGPNRTSRYSCVG